MLCVHALTLAVSLGTTSKSFEFSLDPLSFPFFFFSLGDLFLPFLNDDWRGELVPVAPVCDNGEIIYYYYYRERERVRERGGERREVIIIHLIECCCHSLLQ